MSDETPAFPTVHSHVLGDVACRLDAAIRGKDEPAWIGKVPEALWPRPEDFVEVYIAGGAEAPEPACLAMAERAALDLHSIEAACQVVLAPHAEDAAQQEFWLTWLNFASVHRDARWEAVFLLTSHNILLDDPYGLWIVTMRDETPISVRRDNW